jgi:hypothetical protein
MLEQSLKVIEQALGRANKAGVYELQESAIIVQAFTNIVNELTPKEDVKQVEYKKSK